ncbi:MAG: hypothetical protein AAGB00_09195 [Planctomycetota bacterium]
MNRPRLLPRHLFVAAAAATMVWLATAPDADAARRWRRFRTVRAATPTNTYAAWQRSRRPSRVITYSGVSRAEQDYWRRRDAWYDHAFNGWRPEDFR